MGSPDDDEQTEFTLGLYQAGDHKISVCKAIREITGLDLHKAKDIVESAPTAVLRKVSRDEAMRGKALLEKAGAWATVE